MKNEQSVFTPSGVSYFWAKVSIYGPALMARAFFDGGAESNAVIYSACAHGMALMDSAPKILIKNTTFSIMVTYSLFLGRFDLFIIK